MDNSHHGLVVKQGSILGPFCFNDISDDLIKNVQLFASNTFLFSAVYDVNTSANNLNKDLSKINDWAIQWKMSFNSDPSKQA